MIASSTATALVKSAAVGTTSAAIFALTPLAWAAALVGTCAALYIEKQKEPEKLVRLIFGIMAWTFVAALLAVALPLMPWFSWALDIPLEVRAGLIGSFGRFLAEQARLLVIARREKLGGS